jgi:hypothetical protein
MQLSAATNAEAPPAAAVELDLPEPQAATAAQSAKATHERMMPLMAAAAVMVRSLFPPPARRVADGLFGKRRSRILGSVLNICCPSLAASRIRH